MSRDQTLMAFVITGAAVAAVVLVALALGAGLVGEGSRGDRIGLNITSPFDADTGFARDTHNCPAGEVQRDAEAALLLDLIAPAEAMARELHDDVTLRALTVDRRHDQVTFAYIPESSPNTVHVHVQRPFEAGATGRVQTQHTELPGVPALAPELDLSSLAMGPSMAMELLETHLEGSEDSFVVLSLAREGCHLVWVAFVVVERAEPVLARISTTTGEVRLQPSPFPQQQR